jgi:hypothetical protein
MCDNSSASLVTVRLLRPGFCAAYAVPGDNYRASAQELGARGLGRRIACSTQAAGSSSATLSPKSRTVATRPDVYDGVNQPRRYAESGAGGVHRHRLLTSLRGGR